MRFLARERQVVKLGTMLEMLLKGATIPVGTVAITFDDGYLDNLLVAAPILSRFGLPAILYLATGYVGRVENQWSDVLYAAFVHRTRNVLELEGIGSYRLDTARNCETAYGAIGERLLMSEYAPRSRILNAVIESLRPSQHPPRLTLAWNDVRSLLHKHPDFELGIHTADHIDLTSVPTETAMAEVSRCVQDYKRELGQRPLHFSFPYSRSSKILSERLPAAGLISAMTSSEGIRDVDTVSPFDLGRLEAPASMGLLGHWTSGAYPTLSRRLFGRA